MQFAHGFGGFGILAATSLVAWVGFVFWVAKEGHGWRAPALCAILLTAVLFAGYRLANLTKEAITERIRLVLANVAPMCQDYSTWTDTQHPDGSNSGAMVDTWVDKNSLVSGVFVVTRTASGTWTNVHKSAQDLDKDGNLNGEFEAGGQPGSEMTASIPGLAKAWEGDSFFCAYPDSSEDPKWYALLAPVRDKSHNVRAVAVITSPASAWTRDFAAAQLTSGTLTAVAVLIVLSCAFVITQLGYSLTNLRITKAETALQQEQIRHHMKVIAEKNQEMAENQSRLSEAYAKLRALATTDGLTGLLNHRALMDFLAASMHNDANFASPCSVILIDVDNFKQLNDQYGHPAGDEALRILAAVLAHSSPPGAGVGRYGGEEFMIVLPGASESTAVAVAEELRRRVQIAKTSSRPITVSVGVSTVYSSSKSEQRLIDEADQAMYHSKRSGKNRVAHYGQGVFESAS